MQQSQPSNCILTIFGASGDLTTRKLIPSLFDLQRQNLLPPGMVMLGVSRTAFSEPAFRDKMAQAIYQFANAKPVPEPDVRCFLGRVHYLAMDTGNVADYVKLKDRLDALDQQYHTQGNCVYYLSTPPSLYATIAEALAYHNLNRDIPHSSVGWKRLIIEKPFGYDLKSAQALNQKLLDLFREDQIYRIDHYLGKETVQNVLVSRFANGIFEPLWNRNYVRRMEITAAENIGIEDRGGYYDGAGALRDMVQNHLLQLAGLVAMEPPAVIDATSIRNETLKVFKSLRPLELADIPKYVIRGQYTNSTIKGQPVLGYREEKGVQPDSRTETYVALKFYIDNWRWGGVPFYIRTGKRLPTRVTEIVIHFKPTPHFLFRQNQCSGNGCNQLVIRIQPDEGLLLKFGMKVPGSGFQVQDASMYFHYSKLSNVYLPTAYERLLLDCMLGDATLYIRGDAVEACWEFVAPIQQAWQQPESKIFGYPAGTWGPECADDLMEPGVTWRYPCRNLVDDGNYCEL